MSYCRITGKSRALPKPNYFPLLPPISPADAKRFCRITGKAYGLPSHHYIPVILTTLSNTRKCKITNVSDELGPHHFMPDITYGKRKHMVLADYRYVFPIFDENCDLQKPLIDLLNSKTVPDESKFIYKVDQQKCSLIFSAKLEQAVRDGDVRDVMLAKNCDSVLLKMKQGKSVSVDLQDYDEDMDHLFEGEGPRQDVLLEREKEDALMKKRRPKKLDRAKIFEDKERLMEEEILEYEDQVNRTAKRKRLDQLKKANKKNRDPSSLKPDIIEAQNCMHLTATDPNDLVKPVIESWDWDTYEKEVAHKKYSPVAKKLPKPCQLEALTVTSETLIVANELIENTTGFNSVPCIGPLEPIREQPNPEVIKEIKNMPPEKLEPLLNLSDKILENPELSESIPTPEQITDIVKNFQNGKPDEIAKVPGLSLDIGLAKKVFISGQQVHTPSGDIFVPGQAVSTPQGPIYVPGFTVNTPTGPSFIPGHILTPTNNPSAPVFVAGQLIGDEFVPGQTFNIGETQKFVEGQTIVTSDGIRFVPGVINDKTDAFVPGQKLQTPDGIKFIPGQTLTTEEGNKFVPGQNSYIPEAGWEFVPGQTVETKDGAEFVAGKSIITEEGTKFVPGQHIDDVFVPGITVKTNMGLEFVPGLNVETKQGPKFIEGQVVVSDQGQIFMPGKTILNEQGVIDFAVAKKINDVAFNDPTSTGYVVDVNNTEVSSACLSVFGHMVQTKSGIEFYPEKIDVSHLPAGKRVPGKLLRQDADTKFVPGIMEDGAFVPGQVVWTEKGEQFIPGQVIETSEGLKFVPGQIIETKSGSKFVPGQTIETHDGPRFVPGQIVHTKAGPTFIPGQVIHTEDGGERFVPGQVVDTDDGPRFVPGRVVENGDKVTFIPGQIVQTSEGPKFVAPDLTDNEDGDQQFSVQSFLVSPEELGLLKLTHSWSNTTSKGEQSIDSKMLRQLSEAGMTIGRHIEASAVDIVLQSTKNTQTVKELVQRIGLESEKAETMLEFFQEIEKLTKDIIAKKTQQTNGLCLLTEFKKDLNGNAKLDEKSILVDTIVSTILSTVDASCKKAHQKGGFKHDLPTVFELVAQAFEENMVDVDINVIEKLLKTDTFRTSILENVQQTVAVYGGEANKQDMLHHLVNTTVHDEGELIAKIASVIDDEDLQQAFLSITEQDPKLLYKILNKVRDNTEQIKCDESAGNVLQGCIVSAVKDVAENELRTMFKRDRSQSDIHALLAQSMCLSKALGLSEVAVLLNEVLGGQKSVSALFENAEVADVIRRTVVINKLAKQNPSQYCESLELLAKDPYAARKDPNIRSLIRQSGVMTVIPDEKQQLVDSNDVPLSIFCSDNQLAIEDFLLHRRTKKRGAFLIVKEGYQAVVPRESSRDVLTGKCAYTVLDENGIRHFEPLHVFSALKLNTPQSNHRFSMYSCDFANDEAELVDHNGVNSTSCSSLSNDAQLSSQFLSTSMFNEKENIPTQNTELLATRRKIRDLVRKGGKVPIGYTRNFYKVCDIVVVNQNYTAESNDSISLRRGDLVEVIDYGPNSGDTFAKRPKLDPELDVGQTTDLLENPAAKHKIAVKPRKNYISSHQRSVSPQPPQTRPEPKPGDRWFVRLFDGSDSPKEGWVPVTILDTQQVDSAIYGEKANDAAYRRQAVIRELVETEEEFGRDLQAVVDKYIKTIDNPAVPRVVRDNKDVIFGNFQQIAQFHNTVLIEGVKYYAHEPNMIGKTFLRLERDFDKHVNYCKSEPIAQEFLANNNVARDYFDAFFIEEELSQKLSDDKGLTEHLQLPIQRINDYQLLLKELVKYSLSLNENVTHLQKALELMLSVPHRAIDNKFLASIEGYRGNLHKLGRLLAHEWWTVIDHEGKTKERYIFLFKSRILVCKVRKISEDRSIFLLKDIIKLPECEIKDSADDKTLEIQAKPGVTTTTPLPVKLIAHKDDTKPKWLREIRDHINDPLTLQEHQADDLRIDPTHVLEIDEPIFRLPHKVDAHESDSGIRPSDIAKDYFVTKHKVEEKSVKSEQQVVSSSVESKVEQTVVQRSTVESRTSITGAVEQTTLSAQSVQISKVKDTNQEQIQKVETRAKEEIVVKPEETPKVSRSSAVELTEERKVSQSNVAQSIQSEQQISQSKAISEKRIEEKTTQVKTEQPALLKVDQKQPELQIVQKKEPAPEAPVQKSDAQKEPVVTKQPEIKAIEVAKQPSAKEPEVTKKPEVKESEVTKQPEVKQPEVLKQPEVKEPEVIKQPEVRKPEVGKQPEVKEPEITKQPEIKKPEVKKEEPTPSIPTTEKPKLEEVPLLPDTKQKEQEPTTEAVLTPIHKEDQLLKSIDTAGPGDIEECSESVAGDYRELSSEVESRAPSVARMDDYNYSSRYSSRSSRKRYEITGGRDYDRESSYTSQRYSRTSSRAEDRASIKGDSGTTLFRGHEERTSYSRAGEERSAISRAEDRLALSRGLSDRRGSDRAASRSEYRSSISRLEDQITTGQRSAGKPCIIRTLKGQHVESGENAAFEVQFTEKPGSVTWLKDNKPLDDRLADRIITREIGATTFRLEIKHCR
ncbi:unnamed protein product [Hermetia illucens]|uniref:Obscurin n=1 Tax=Hermetia illucens TaxID=343691 RepID=A0A7R8UAV7_HERIL|nr:unnamed protein product [Hermetia illucens]